MKNTYRPAQDLIILRVPLSKNMAANFFWYLNNVLLYVARARRKKAVRDTNVDKRWL
jgi:hypothetical protein